MDYSRDLLKLKKKSKLALIFSILFYLIAISWIPIRLIEKGAISGFDWFYTSIMLFNGISQTMAARGYSIERLIGKAFIKIDSQVVIIKTGVFDKKQSIYWSEISSIDYKPSNFVITKNDSSTYNLNMTKLEYSEIQEIKNVIDRIAKDKNVSINLN